ncbi:MAG: hypothetical protein HS104_30145 [Polyangiaceae bacterium]|nr:hypothetical protein [Polyangiaceae bacterium]MCE7888761.1 hypothetical protein [Sorangiineae bacterium PRO1]MCL4753499.1 hypothetical protein [Myxococcales bacterium]
MSGNDEEERGLTEEELEEVTGGAVGDALKTAKLQGIKTTTTVKKLPGGGSAIHIKSDFGALPGGGSTVIKGA